MSQLNLRKTIRPSLSKWLILGLIPLALLIVLWAGRHQFLEWFNFFKDREAITAYLDQLGYFGPLLYLLILGLQITTAIIPGHALMISAGYLYGFSGGFLLNLIGAVGTSQLVFVVSQRAGQPFVRRLVPAPLFQRWHSIVKRQGFFFFLTCFLFPVIPSNATNYIAGLSSISFWLFFLANLLGRLPGLVFITLIGSHGLELTWSQWIVLAVIGLFFMAGGRYLAAKVERRFTGPAETLA